MPEPLFLRPATLLKKRLWHRIFPVDFAKFLRIAFLTEHVRWLLLDFLCLLMSAELWFYLFIQLFLCSVLYSILVSFFFSNILLPVFNKKNLKSKST